MQDGTSEFKYSQQGSKEFNLKDFITQNLKYLPWLLISVLVCLSIAYIKLRYSTPIYSVSGKIMIKKDQGMSSANDKFDDIFMMPTNRQGIGDQMELIRSSSMAARVVRSLNLQTQYFSIGKVRTSQLYKTETPVLLEIDELKDSSGFSLQVTLINDQEFQLQENGPSFKFGVPFDLPFGRIRIIRTSLPISVLSSNKMVINWLPLIQAARQLSGSIKVAQVGELNANVLLISQSTENQKLGIDVVNAYISAFQDYSLEEKQSSAVKILQFIDQQLDTVYYDLASVENSLKTFRENNNLINIEAQSNLFMDQLSETERETAEMEVKIKLVDYLIAYITDKRQPFRTVQATLGIEEPALLQAIAEYNSLQLRRETALLTIPERNITIREIEAAIFRLKEDIERILKDVKNGYQLSLSKLQQSKNSRAQDLKKVPMREKQLLEIMRRQKIMEELYSFLLRKKLETSIGSASSLSNIDKLEPAIGSGVPISPNKSGTFTLALALGLIIPIGIIYLKELLNDKVKSKSDIEKITNAPILGEVGHSKSKQTLVATKENRNFVAEQFRILRTNLRYVLPEEENPTVLVTSSYSGEGKSFVSTNIGAVLALSGKKTVILEFDIRKPKILEGLNMKSRTGITNFLVSDLSADQIIYPVDGVENLFVVPCGPIPPNPSELLLNKKLDILFEYLKNNFDAVVIDSAPVGLVSDAISLSKYAKASIYIVRHGYTVRKQIKMVDQIYQEKRLPKLSIVINDIDQESARYGYGTYGYGYGYAYFDGEENTSWWKKILKKANRKKRK